MALLKPELALTPNSRSWLKTLEGELALSFASEVKTLQEIPQHLLSIGGKRIRPALTFMMAELFNVKKFTAELLDIAAGVELIHMATLLHDDIIDEAPTRRGQPSALAKYGLTPTLLSGNFLFVRAFGRCARLPSFIIRQTEDTCIALTEGELLEEDGIFSVENSLKIGQKKTGSLFGLAALAGVFVGTKSEQLALIAREFGLNLGIAFQISDDILDITSTRGELGKEPGTDLREQKPSIVNTLWLSKNSPLSPEILLSDNPPKENLVQKALQELLESSVLDEARAYGTQSVNAAKAALAELSTKGSINKSVFERLQGLCQFALHRLK